MKRDTIIWIIVFAFGAIGLFYNGAIRPHGMGKKYVHAVPISEKHPDAGMRYEDVSQKDVVAKRAGVSFSAPRTIGIWLAALLTLFIFSFLYGDNPFYKIAESIFVGSSAAWYMVAAFWDQLIPNMVAKLAPGVVRAWALPDLPKNEPVLLVRIIPLILCIMLLWRLAPKGQWIGRWPLGVIIGTKSAFQMLVFIQSDLLSQVRNTIVPLVVIDRVRGLDVWESIKNTLTVLSVLACLVYFFFSFEHKGAKGKVARVGIWVLMITFGASFGLTVMGRITLLTDRIVFLLDDWLWLIDPTNSRAIGLLWGYLQ